MTSYYIVTYSKSLNKRELEGHNNKISCGILCVCFLELKGRLEKEEFSTFLFLEGENWGIKLNLAIWVSFFSSNHWR